MITATNILAEATEAAGSHMIETVLAAGTVVLALATITLIWVTARLTSVTNQVAVVEMRKLAEAATEDMRDVAESASRPRAAAVHHHSGR